MMSKKRILVSFILFFHYFSSTIVFRLLNFENKSEKWSHFKRYLENMGWYIICFTLIILLSSLILLNRYNFIYKIPLAIYVYIFVFNIFDILDLSLFYQLFIFPFLNSSINCIIKKYKFSYLLKHIKWFIC